MRNMRRCDIDDIATNTPELELRGVEDMFAKGTDDLLENRPGRLMT
jgi:hypothetical protein